MKRTKSEHTSRRRFLAVAGAAAAAAALAPTRSLLAQTARARDGTKAAASKPTAADTAKAAAAPQTPPEVAAEARALLAVVQQRYGKFLDAKQLEAVTQELEFRVQAGKRLRGVKLGNHEEPDFTFKA